MNELMNEQSISRMAHPPLITYIKKSDPPEQNVKFQYIAFKASGRPIYPLTH